MNKFQLQGNYLNSTSFAGYRPNNEFTFENAIGSGGELTSRFRLPFGKFVDRSDRQTSLLDTFPADLVGSDPCSLRIRFIFYRRAFAEMKNEIGEQLTQPSRLVI